MTTPKNTKKNWIILILPWIVWCVGCLFYFHQYFLRLSVSGLSSELIHHFDINAVTLSNIAASFFYAYVLFQIPSGLLIDRFGAKIMLIVATSCCAIGCLFFGLSYHLFLIEIGRIFMGAGAAFALIITLTLARNWFPKHLFSSITGLTIAIGTLGAVVGGEPLTIWAQYLGRTKIMWAAFFICIFLIATGLYLIKNTPKPQKNKKTPSWKKTFADLLQQLKTPTVWLIGLLMAFSLVPLFCFGSLWSKPFLITEYHISAAKAALAPSLIFTGTAIGAPLAGLLTKYFKDKILLIMIGNFTSLLTILVSVYIEHLPISLILLLFLLLGFSLGFAFIGLTIAKEITPPRHTATVLSLVNVIYNLIGAISLPFVGYILNKNWGGEILNHVRIYHLSSYHTALLVMPISIILAILIGILLKRKTNLQVVS